MPELRGVAGIIVFIGVALLLSTNRRQVKWRPIVWGIVLQIIIAALFLGKGIGLEVFQAINNGVVGLLDHAREGAYLVFGQLAIPPGQTGPEGEKSLGFFLAFQALPTIIFFSALMATLYYIGVMPIILRFFSYIFTKFMHLSGAESLCTASNTVVGIESVFAIRPYLSQMTHSEFHQILTAGMATIASSVLGFYVLLLKDTFPMIAGHLVSASLLSAPAAVVMAKAMFPETETPKTMGKVVSGERVSAHSLVEAILLGANEGLKLTLGIVALLIAFLGLVSLANALIGWTGLQLSHIGIPLAGITLQKILGWVFYPFTILIGVDVKDAGTISMILGERTILTEVVSYKDLARFIASGRLADPKSAVIASYALCGFSHVASVAIFVGGISALVPERARDIASLGLRALVAATLACFQTAAVASIFIPAGQSILFKG
ncbi:nucleoside transporter [Candidatus Sumerlaeota bacterium]|nr:nucleoside transporter [Candidatus Sumerlaeota bacterium]